MSQTTRIRTSVILGMILGAAMLRIVPHPPNFTPIGAMALFGGAHFCRKGWAFLAPLCALFLSDLVLSGLLSWQLFHAHQPAVYGSFALIVGLGMLLQRRRRILPIAGATLAGAVLFFVVTNFSVWALGTSYPKTPAGLLACYTMAIPWFGNTLAGDLFFTTVLFGGFALAERRLPVLAWPVSQAHA